MTQFVFTSGILIVYFNSLYQLQVPVADPDLQMGGGGDHPDPRIRGRDPFSKIVFLGPLGLYLF